MSSDSLTPPPPLVFAPNWLSTKRRRIETLNSWERERHLNLESAEKGGMMALFSVAVSRPSHHLVEIGKKGFPPSKLSSAWEREILH